MKNRSVKFDRNDQERPDMPEIDIMTNINRQDDNNISKLRIQ